MKKKMKITGAIFAMVCLLSAIIIAIIIINQSEVKKLAQLEDSNKKQAILEKSTLTIDPNGGTWNGSTNNSVFEQNPYTKKVIGRPIPPVGRTVTFESNG